MTFSLVHIELPDIANCSDAYLSVYDGISLDSPKIGQYCSRTLPHRITSQSNALTIRLHMAGYYPMASGKKNIHCALIKGQLISKCLFVVIVWTKIATKILSGFLPCPCSFLGASWKLFGASWGLSK